MSNGYIVALACGPLKKQRYVNPKIEKELVEFKKEISEKHQKSQLKSFVFPRKTRRNAPETTRDSSSMHTFARVQQSTEGQLNTYLHSLQIQNERLRNQQSENIYRASD